jgi:hypothetical protein
MGSSRIGGRFRIKMSGLRHFLICLNLAMVGNNGWANWEVIAMVLGVSLTGLWIYLFSFSLDSGDGSGSEREQ